MLKPAPTGMDVLTLLLLSTNLSGQRGSSWYLRSSSSREMIFSSSFFCSRANLSFSSWWRLSRLWMVRSSPLARFCSSGDRFGRWVRALAAVLGEMGRSGSGGSVVVVSAIMGDPGGVLRGDSLE